MLPRNCAEVMSITRLAEPCAEYVPEWLNGDMIAGWQTIHQHLVADHELQAEEVEAMSNDDCYRKHDALHEAEEAALSVLGSQLSRLFSI